MWPILAIDVLESKVRRPISCSAANALLLADMVMPGWFTSNLTMIECYVKEMREEKSDRDATNARKNS